MNNKDFKTRLKSAKKALLKNTNNDQDSLNKYMLKMVKNRKDFFNNFKKNQLLLRNSLSRSNFNLFFNMLLKR